MRDIAHEAEIISTDGMNDQQKKYVTRIRYTAHECLRDHSRNSTLVIDNSENEAHQRIGEKMRVRRRGSTKRRREDEPNERENGVEQVDEEEQLHRRSEENQSEPNFTVDIVQKSSIGTNEDITDTVPPQHVYSSKKGKACDTEPMAEAEAEYLFQLFGLHVPRNWQH